MVLKRIIYLHQYFNFPTGSGSTRSYDLSKEFLKKGFEVVVVTTSAFLNIESKKRWTKINREGLEIHILKSNYSNNLGFGKRIIEFIRFLFYSTIRILKLKANIIIATSTPLTIGIPALIKKIINKTPYIFEVRDVWPDVPVAMGIIRNGIVIFILKKVEKLFYKNAYKIVALSDDMSTLIQAKGIAEEKIVIIPNISDLNKFDKSNLHSVFEEKGIDVSKKKIVLYAGTIGYVNGLSYMVELANQFKKAGSENVLFVIIGSGIEKKKVYNLAEAHNVLNENLFILDPVGKEQLPALYKECTVACSWVINIPALWANSANKYFDSLAAGKPIIINYKGWQAKEIKSNKIGTVLDIESEKGAQQLASYLNDEKILESHGENARKLAVSKYSLEVAAERYLEIINEINNV